MDTIINASGIRKAFGEQKAVDGIDLQVQAGTILGVIGPNGAGKTTLLRSLLGLCQCEGELEVLGCDPRRERSRMLDQVCSIADTADDEGCRGATLWRAITLTPTTSLSKSKLLLIPRS